VAAAFYGNYFDLKKMDGTVSFLSGIPRESFPESGNPTAVFDAPGYFWAISSTVPKSNALFGQDATHVGASPTACRSQQNVHFCIG
jgi:hypothetical protein